MSNQVPADMPASEYEDEGRERLSYMVGLGLALLLTGAAFALVWFELLKGGAALAALGLLAFIQALVHLRYFLHIDLARSHRDDLKLILFTVLILLLMVSGTIWILYDQHIRMMP
ncbi:cytochrome o ubiquinol oxidase subunit IV [Ancylobacter pratisalsi]|uniref:Cytochrome bo(3) ubiquinol oxidase subunit 4 n=1 Tax=Ancylobacter pratisalsi TaxID=1745854 RepID=A0A6P1YPI9_9HYPH|nr:cytochrome o ubiquinol oxidase subunit IV [Ancylobacter pratisalsi]QIB34641.1 cytochrome o ubiquinol oxidase subunit IV [Ancylobacter pratisalsi]